MVVRVVTIIVDIIVSSIIKGEEKVREKCGKILRIDTHGKQKENIIRFEKILISRSGNAQFLSQF